MGIVGAVTLCGMKGSPLVNGQSMGQAQSDPLTLHQVNGERGK